MNKTIFLSIFLVFCLVISSIILIFSPSPTYFEVQRDRQVISLDAHQSMPVLSNYAFHINRIIIDLTKGSTFMLIYQGLSDTPTSPTNQTYSQTTHLVLNLDSLKFLTLNSTSQALQGFIEIDYGYTNSVS